MFSIDGGHQTVDLTTKRFQVLATLMCVPFPSRLKPQFLMSHTCHNGTPSGSSRSVWFVYTLAFLGTSHWHYRIGMGPRPSNNKGTKKDGRQGKGEIRENGEQKRHGYRTTVTERL